MSAIVVNAAKSDQTRVIVQPTNASYIIFEEEALQEAISVTSITLIRQK